jgi:hypothetical protein
MHESKSTKDASQGKYTRSIFKANFNKLLLTSNQDRERNNQL